MDILTAWTNGFWAAKQCKLVNSFFFVYLLQRMEMFEEAIHRWEKQFLVQLYMHILEPLLNQLKEVVCCGRYV